MSNVPFVNPVSRPLCICNLCDLQCIGNQDEQFFQRHIQQANSPSGVGTNIVANSYTILKCVLPLMFGFVPLSSSRRIDDPGKGYSYKLCWFQNLKDEKDLDVHCRHPL